MNYYHTYILHCSDHSFYTGVTNELNKRIAEHNDGKDHKSYTYSRRPLKLVYTEEFTDIQQAIAREKQIKGWSRIKKIALIENNQRELVLRSKRSKKTKSTI